MFIGIDAHSLEGKRTGVGRVLFNILSEWTKSRSAENIKFILYFKDQIPFNLPKAVFFEAKLLNSKSTAKFIHWNLCRAAKKDKLDVLFCPEYVGPIFYRGKIAVLLHDISYEAHPEQFNWKSPADKILLKWVSKKIAKRAEIVFAPLKFDKNEIIKYYGVNPEKIVVIGEGVDPVFLETEIKKDEEVLKKYGIYDKYIFYVGSIFSRRHLSEIVKAFFKIAENRSDLQFLIGGIDYTDSKVVDEMAERINDRLKRKAILRTDFIGDDDLPEIYRNCEFLIWLSDYEGFGLPIVEAMSCGAAVITTDGASLREVAGDAAFLIKNNLDVEEIYQGMKNLLEDENLRRQLIEKGKEQAKKFDWRDCAETVLNSLINICPKN
jgi:glycosyltransferase involved in cell wall biosynthesis